MTLRSICVRLGRGDLLLERRVTTLAYRVFTERGRGECASSEGRTQLRYIAPTFHRVWRWWSHKTTPPITVGLLLMPRPLNQQAGLIWTSDFCERS